MNTADKKPIEFVSIRDAQNLSGHDKSILETIEHINRKIASIETLSGTIDFLFDNTQGIIPCDRLAISFFEENGSRLRIHHVAAAYKKLYLKDGYSADLGGSSLTKVFSSGDPRIINNLAEYLKTHQASDSTRLLLHEGINSSMTCPVSVEGRPVGLLFFSSRQTDIYTKDHLAMILMIIERIGQAVEKTWHIEQLSEAINSYMEMLSFVSHELKSPLDSIISLGNTLSGGYFGKMDEKHKGYVERMVIKAKYLREMTSEYMTLSQFETGKINLNMKSVHILKDIVAEAIDIVMPQAAEKRMNIHVPPSESDTEFKCDPSLVKIVVNNLMSNAVKYGNIDGDVTISLNVTDDKLTLAVRNTGPGFPEEAKQKLFRKFSRIDKKELMERKGTGVGLYSSWRIIQLHGGSMKAESVENQWAEFSFTLPLRGI
ncbi:MAG TPA: GAF domain-containing sensor histidine kinase [Spirochaetota bacterium]|nr:GAF domain-containing sensor histidine kinase [Spirochaetota bacterium]